MQNRPDVHSLDPLLRWLMVNGPSSAADVCAALGISQSTFSRSVARQRQRILVVGKARAARYAARRQVRDLPASIPVYEIGDGASATREWLRIEPVHPTGFILLSIDAPARFAPNLPWFLDDLRPSGFLGRLLPRLHPELAAPPDIRHWLAEDTLRYLVRFGWNNIGNIVVGDGAYRLMSQNMAEPSDCVLSVDRAQRYGEWAEEVLRHGLPGSSAAGEQPKFLATKRDGSADVPVIVKFSPPVADAVSQRVADLLVCEHLAHATLGEHGQASAGSELIHSENRVFLEVRRFDRSGPAYRHGVYSLTAIDSERVGSDLSSWSAAAAGLLAARVIDAAMYRQVRWLELFGRLIANTDMHAGNLSFLARGDHVLGVAPSYDMSPTLYAPQAGQLLTRRYMPPVAAPSDVDVWPTAHAAAVSYWDKVTLDERVSVGFRAVAAENWRALVS